MEQVATNLVYTTKEGNPVISHTYEFTPKETEILELREQIEEDCGASRLDAAYYASRALPRPDASFIEWLTDGVLSLDESGKMIAVDPHTMEWLKAKQVESLNLTAGGDAA